jgi:hypothetical protein
MMVLRRWAFPLFEGRSPPSYRALHPVKLNGPDAKPLVTKTSKHAAGSQPPAAGDQLAGEAE